MLALTGVFELALDSYEAGVISSVWWSSVMGYPIPHHFWIGFGLAFISYWGIIINWERVIKKLKDALNE